jgi:signal transduction histidine kinase/DNA-binding NarL/FixJ family response regulator
MEAVDQEAFRISTLTAEFVSPETETSYQSAKWKERSAQNRLIAVVWFCAVCLAGFFHLASRQQPLILWEKLFIAANLCSVLGILFLSSLRRYHPFYDAALWLDAVAFLAVLAFAVVRGEPNSPFWISTFIAIPLVLNVAFAIRTYYTWGATAACLAAFHAVVRAQEFEPEFAGLLMLQIALSAGVGLVMHRMINSSQRREFARWSAEKQWSSDLERAKQEAERANRSKSDFLSSMSHELRTPLNGVLGLSALLKKTPLDERQSQYARGIGESARQLLDLLDDLLDLSKIEAGKLVLKSEPFSPLEAARESVAMVAWFASEKGLELKTEWNGRESLHIAGDRVRFRQILINLLMNALKYTEKGEVRLDMRACEAGDGKMDLRVEVQDQGSGIDEETRDRLFERFYQGRDGSGGWGLGLAIVKELAEAMDGSVSVRSSKGGGSCFILDFPRMRVESPRPEKKAVAVPRESLAGLRVLFAEDNRINALIGADLLRSMGLGTVEVVRDGKAAVASALQFSYDLIFMDLAMPEMDGVEAVRQLRAKAGPNQKTPVIAMSAYADVEHQRLSLEAGMDVFLPKPFSEEDLARILSDFRTEPLPKPAGSSSVRAEAIAMAMEDFPQHVRKIRDAWERGDPAGLKHAAHTLKGAAAVLEAREVRDMAAALSEPGMKGDIASEIGQLKRAVESWMARTER